jgi:hypothetical protein
MKRSPVELDGDVLGLTRIEVYFHETFQFLDWARDWSVMVANEYLCDVRAGRVLVGPGLRFY